MPPTGATITGYSELIVSLKALPKATEVALKAGFRKIGQMVATDARRDFTGGVARSASVEKTAAGFRPYVRIRGVEVDQTLRKTTGLRGDWGVRQMRVGLIPALEEDEPAIVAEIAVAVDEARVAVGL